MSFYRIPSVVQIWLAQVLVLLFFSDPVLRLVNWLFKPATGIKHTRFDWFDIVPWTIGALCLYWLMRTIFAPSLGRVRWVPVHVAGPIAVWNDKAAVRYSFPSTHPSYVFMDALAAGLAIFIYWAWSTAWEERRLEGLIMLVVGVLTPAARLFAWYILGLKPMAPSSDPDAVKHANAVLRAAWRPVFAFYAVLVPIIVIAGGASWYFTERDARARVENAIRIDPTELATSGRYFEQIRDSSVSSSQQSKLARIVIDNASEPVHCEPSVWNDFRATIGAAGSMMIVAQTQHLNIIRRRLAAGQPADLVGILVRPPRAIPNWRTQMYCSLARGAAPPRWIFEVESVVGK